MALDVAECALYTVGVRTEQLQPRERLRHWREIRGLSQADLGRRCGMPPYKISRIETGAVSVTAEELELIASHGLELTMTEFYGEAS